MSKTDHTITNSSHSYSRFIKAKSSITQQPTLADYTVGEKWVWKYRGVNSEREVCSNGTDIREIVNFRGGLSITIGADTVPANEIVKPNSSKIYLKIFLQYYSMRHNLLVLLHNLY